MAPGKPRDQGKERQWRRWIDQWRSSGLSVRIFCGQRGLSEPSFYQWRKILQRRAAEDPAWLPVHLIADQVPAQGGALELVLAGGRRLRVRPGFDSATLRQLVAVLEEMPPC